MSLDQILSVLVAGTLTGTVYALMALGLTAVFGVMKIVNFAHGNLVVIGMYLAWLLNQHLGWDPLASVPVVGAALFVVGYLIQRGIVSRIMSGTPAQQLLVMVALAMVLNNGLSMLFGPDPRGVQVSYDLESFEVGAILVDKVRVYAALMAAVAIAVLSLFFSRTETGKAIRACADNPTGSQVIGLNAERLYRITFGLGAASVGVAGCLMLLVNVATPQLAPEFTVLAFIIVVVGGMGSFVGSLLGGLLIGISEAVSGYVIDPSLKSVFSFALLIAVLLLRPNGLMGRAT